MITDPLPRVRPEAGAMRRGRSTNGDITLIPMLQRRKAMTESAQSFADVVIGHGTLRMPCATRMGAPREGKPLLDLSSWAAD